MGHDLYKLSKWSRLVRIRDEGVCQMCSNKVNIWKLHAHHIYPKHYVRYKSKVYQLNNGVSLCRRCHLSVVHSEIKNWKRYTGMFRQYQMRKHIKEFNKNRQDDV